jgi:hypothetical protein
MLTCFFVVVTIIEVIVIIVIISQVNALLERLTLTARARACEHQAWRGGRHFLEADCLPLLSSSIKLVCEILELKHSAQRKGHFALCNCLVLGHTKYNGVQRVYCNHFTAVTNWTAL